MSIKTVKHGKLIQRFFVLDPQFCPAHFYRLTSSHDPVIPNERRRTSGTQGTKLSATASVTQW